MEKNTLMANGKSRNSNIELLRIISMFMVLVLHCLSASGALDYKSGVQYWIYWWLEAACIIAVNIFALITGYFMIESSFKVRNLFKIGWEGVWVYSVIFSLINIFVSGDSISGSYLLRMFFPILTKKFWFVNSYLALYLISPFLNKLIHQLLKKQFDVLLVIIISLFSLRVTFLPLRWAQDSTGGMGLIWFIVLYCIGAWLRLYYKKTEKSIWYFGVYVLMTFVLTASKKAMIVIGMGNDYTSKFYGYSSFFVLVEAVAFFLVFLNSKPINSNIGNTINRIAKHSFSVYIIHFAMTSVLWTNILHVDVRIDNVLTGTITVLLSAVLVYFFCTLVDIVKDFLFSKMKSFSLYMRLSGKIYALCTTWESILNS